MWIKISARGGRERARQEREFLSNNDEHINVDDFSLAMTVKILHRDRKKGHRVKISVTYANKYNIRGITRSVYQ